LLGPEQVDERGGDIRQQQHVGLVDLLEATDGGAVEGESVAHHRLVERLHRNSEVLHRSQQVTESDVDVLDIFVADIAQQLIRVGEQGSPPGTSGADMAVAGRSAPVRGPVAATVGGRLPTTLSRRRCPAVSRRFRPCYGLAGRGGALSAVRPRFSLSARVERSWVGGCSWASSPWGWRPWASAAGPTAPSAACPAR